MAPKATADCMSLTTAATRDIIFDVKGYTATKQMCKGSGGGGYFQSHKFSVGSYEWAVRYYPDQGGAGVFVAVTLVLLGKLNNKDAGHGQQQDDVGVRFACTLLDRHGQWSTERSRSASYVFSGYGQEKGFWTFTTHDVLDDPDFVVGDCFALLCVVSVLRKPIL